MLPLDIIRKYYPNLSDDDLKKIQVFVYELCCGLMQHFYGEDWDKDIDEMDLENEFCAKTLISSCDPTEI